MKHGCPPTLPTSTVTAPTSHETHLFDNVSARPTSTVRTATSYDTHLIEDNSGDVPQNPTYSMMLAPSHVDREDSHVP